MNRFTFVVQVHPEGISTLENLSTQERIRLSALAAVGPQIERWLAEAEDGVRPVPKRTARDLHESTPE
jgi:hypothetical protein